MACLWFPFKAFEQISDAFAGHVVSARYDLEGPSSLSRSPKAWSSTVFLKISDPAW